MNRLTNNIFPYKWYLKDGYPSNGVEKHGLKVFSTFACGGGSTMGYKLAGYNVLGCLEIDPKIIACYKENHKPKYAYEQGIQDFKLRDDLPEELYNVDILDQSPPCSSFSMAGSREKAWGKEKVFREGQTKQVLDTLFFDSIELVGKLQPKVCIFENVEAMLFGSAREYVRRVLKELDEVGYYVQHFVLDASRMGVPQRRKRVFFIGLRKDLAAPFLVQKDLFTILPELNLNFVGKDIPYKEFEEKDVERVKLNETKTEKWVRTPLDGHPEAGNGSGNTFGFFYKVSPDRSLATITAGSSSISHYLKPELLTDNELMMAGSYPLDYNFLNVKPQYLIGMSVPPVVTACIADQIYKQWLSKL